MAAERQLNTSQFEPSFARLLPAALLVICACAGSDDEPCNDHIQQGDELDVRFLERYTTEATLVQPPPDNGAWTPELSCGDEVDFAPGDALMFRVGRTRALRHSCIGNWVDLENPENLHVESVLDHSAALNMQMYLYAAEVTLDGCPGVAEVGFSILGEDLAEAEPGAPPPALLVRLFFPQQDCGFAQGYCWDEYAVEVSHR